MTVKHIICTSMLEYYRNRMIAVISVLEYKYRILHTSYTWNGMPALDSSPPRQFDISSASLLLQYYVSYSIAGCVQYWYQAYLAYACNLARRVWEYLYCTDLRLKKDYYYSTITVASTYLVVVFEYMEPMRSANIRSAATCSIHRDPPRQCDFVHFHWYLSLISLLFQSSAALLSRSRLQDKAPIISTRGLVLLL